MKHCLTIWILFFSSIYSIYSQNSRFIRTADGVTQDMRAADFWIERIPDAQRIIKTKSEIKNMAEKSDRANFEEEKRYYEAIERSKSSKYKKNCGYFLFSEKNGRRKISKNDITELIECCALPRKPYYKNGRKVELAYIKKLEDNRNDKTLKEKDNEIKYGFTVKRGGLRILPTDEVFSEEAKYTFYDELQNTSILLNEPVVVLCSSRDGKFYYVLTRYAFGWIRKSEVGLCSFNEWYANKNPKNFLMIAENKFNIDYDRLDDNVSEHELTLGTKLELVPVDEYKKSKEGREAFDNYVVKIPCRNSKGNLYYAHAFVPASRKVSIGYVPYTRENILKMAFTCLGERYGWAGMYNARDCSQFIMELYRCFGIYLPRSTVAMANMYLPTVDVSEIDSKEKSEILEYVPAGAILIIPGHAMIYLGEYNGNYYVISSSGELIEPSAPGKLTQAQSVMVNNLGMLRPDGKTWLDSITKCKIVY